MDWIQVTVLTTTAGSELVSQALIDEGSAGTMIEDKNDIAIHQRPEGQWDIIDEAIAERMGDDVRVSAYYAADFLKADLLGSIRRRMDALRALGLEADLGKLTIETVKVDDEDWAEYWKKHYTPVRLGRHFVVKPGWTEYDERPGDKLIHIDPGMAFGTGTHETTGLCVELIEEIVRPGDTVIDIGTGTGILAIAAALCGAKDVLATDIDPVAVRVAEENIAENGLSGVIRARQGDLLKAVSERAKIVTANIIADVIIDLAAPVKDFIVDGGVFICSGIAVNRVAEVRTALEHAGYRDLDIRERGEWAAIAGRK